MEGSRCLRADTRTWTLNLIDNLINRIHWELATRSERAKSFMSVTVESTSSTAILSAIVAGSCESIESGLKLRPLLTSGGWEKAWSDYSSVIVRCISSVSSISWPAESIVLCDVEGATDVLCKTLISSNPIISSDTELAELFLEDGSVIVGSDFTVESNLLHRINHFE